MVPAPVPAFSEGGRRRKTHKMEENLRRLSHCLNQASEVVQQLASATSNSASNSASNSVQTMVGTSGGMTSVSQAVSRARAMMHQSTSRGLYSRLGARERLRAASSTNSAPNNSKRPKDDNRLLVSSVGRAPVCCAEGRGFEPQTGPTLRVLK